MAVPKNAFSLWGQYLAARTAEMVLTTFEARDNLRAAGAIGQAIYYISKRHRERAMIHLRMAFPDKNEEQLKELAIDCFEHFVQLVVEVCHTPRLIGYDTWHERIALGPLAPAIRMLNEGKPAILITGHLGNWEVLGSLLAILGYEVDAVARPLDNPLVNDWLLGIRQKRGLRIITKWQASDRMMEVLRNGGALGIIADQNAGEKGMFVPFFGKLASTYKSVGLLAMRQKVPVVCGYAHRVGNDCCYELGVEDIIEPDQWANQPDPLFYITARYMRAIENMVRRVPKQYLWMHRRWKTRPAHEKAGKPMPDTLRAKLESLPWMTPELMASLREPVPEIPGRRR
jgi:KDO2-lipid IV(A) lauroyltransferase